jgi:carbon monoxide dehydrogenase subunit G
MAIEVTGEQIVAAAPESVFAGLLDPARLKAAIPGCEALTIRPDGAFALTIAIGIGPIRKTATTIISLVEAVPPVRLVAVRGRPGELTGPGRVEAAIDLAPAAGGTRLAYKVELEAAPPFSALGDFLIKPAVRKGVQQFFAGFAAGLAGDA